MDINCTHPCYYQSEGKCNLRELPSAPVDYTHYYADCPYFCE